VQQKIVNIVMLRFSQLQQSLTLALMHESSLAFHVTHKTQMDEIDKEKIPLPRSLHRVRDPISGRQCVYPIGIGQEKFSQGMRVLMDYRYKEGDVWVCSVAKSGTTWTEYIAWLVTHEGGDFPAGKSMSEAIPMIEFDACEIGDLPPPRIIKTHYEKKWIPMTKEAKYIYVARNPKDVLVSYLYHCRGFGCYGAPDLTIEELIEPMAHGEIEFGNHCDHVAEWYKARNEENVLFLLYEEMKADLKGSVMRIAEFLGKSEVLLKDDGKLWKEIVDKCSFSSMNKSNNDKWVRGNRDGFTKFVRKGTVGDHVNHLTKEQIKIFDDVMNTKGKRLGIDHLWKN